MSEKWNEATIPGMVFNRMDRYGDRAMLVSKTSGQWESSSWNEIFAQVKKVSLGLVALGFEPRQMAAILSTNRKFWTVCDLAIMSAGGVTVPIYASNLPKSCAYIIEHSDSRFAFVENAEQMEKVLQTWGDLPALEKVILIEGEKPDHENVITIAELMEMGTGGDEKVFEERVSAIDPEDFYTISYTSGTTGPPKGALLTHRSMRCVNVGVLELMKFYDTDRTLSFLPLAHMMERFIHYSSIQAGVTIHFAESIQTVPENLLEVRPHAFLSVPRLFEKVYAKILNQVENGPAIKRKMFYWARQVGIDFAQRDVEGQPISIFLKLQHALADRLVFGKIREKLGGCARQLGSGGAPLSSEIIQFFYGAGLPVVEAYGLTETSAPATLNCPPTYRFGTVGKAIRDVEVKIADDGEILIRGGDLFSGYFKRPDTTAEAMVDGWFRSGDIGEIDKDGFLKVTDRKKDLIITAGGKNIAPQNIENLVKTDRYLSQVVVIGDKLPYLTALVTLDPLELEKWSGEQGLGKLSDEELAGHPKVRELVQGILDEKNQDLARYEQIKKFEILTGDFSIESGEITPTMKVKRNVVSKKYADRIQKMYSA